MPEKGKRTERLIFEISKCGKERWNFYKKYHYLNDNLATNSHCFEITLKGKAVGFLAIRKFMHPVAKNIQMISRIVIIPEFQGFGLALKFMNIISMIYKSSGEQIRIVTSLKPFIKALKKSSNWKLERFGRVANSRKNAELKQKSISYDRITASFLFKGVENGPT